MEKENFILKLAEYQDKRKKKREDILEKYNKLNFKIDSICDADTGAIFLTDEDSVIKRKKLIEYKLYQKILLLYFWPIVFSYSFSLPPK